VPYARCVPSFFVDTNGSPLLPNAAAKYPPISKKNVKDPAEVARVRDYFLKQKLGLTNSDADFFCGFPH